jgi:hypothetical protein
MTIPRCPFAFSRIVCHPTAAIICIDQYCPFRPGAQPVPVVDLSQYSGNPGQLDREGPYSDEVRNDV